MRNGASLLVLDVEVPLADVAGVVRLDEVLVEVARVIEALRGAELAGRVPEEAGKGLCWCELGWDGVR
jgi:hypothetical protein